MRAATAIYSVSAALLCMGVGTLVLVWGLRVSIDEALVPQETTITGGTVPITIREVPMHEPPTLTKVINGVTVTYLCPPRDIDGETEEEYGARCKALFAAWCKGFEE